MGCLTSSTPSMQLVHWMRHGRSQMNDFLAEHPYKSPGFEDPLL